MLEHRLLLRGADPQRRLGDRRRHGFQRRARSDDDGRQHQQCQYQPADERSRTRHAEIIEEYGKPQQAENNRGDGRQVVDVHLDQIGQLVLGSELFEINRRRDAERQGQQQRHGDGEERAHQRPAQPRQFGLARIAGGEEAPGKTLFYRTRLAQRFQPQHLAIVDAPLTFGDRGGDDSPFSGHRGVERFGSDDGIGEKGVAFNSRHPQSAAIGADDPARNDTGGAAGNDISFASLGNLQGAVAGSYVDTGRLPLEVQVGIVGKQRRNPDRLTDRIGIGHHQRAEIIGSADREQAQKLLPGGPCRNLRKAGAQGILDKSVEIAGHRFRRIDFRGVHRHFKNGAVLEESGISLAGDVDQQKGQEQRGENQRRHAIELEAAFGSIALGEEIGAKFSHIAHGISARREGRGS